MEFNMWLQSRLTAHGFAVGGIDGVVGKTTIAAIKAFERAHKMPVNGTADAAVVEALRKSSTDDVTSKQDSFFRGARDANVSGKSTNVIFPRQKDVVNFYGKVGTSQSSIIPPWAMRLAWDKRRFIKRMTLHEKCAASAARAMKRVYAHYGEAGIKMLGLDMFGGSLNVRKVRGGSRYSMHSWGIAIDFDPERNGLRTKAPEARLSRGDVVPFWEAWEAEGWVSLGRERDFDWMHVQAARL